MHKRNIFFFVNSQYGFIYALSRIFVFLLDLLEHSEKNENFFTYYLCHSFLHSSIKIMQFLCSQIFISFTHSIEKPLKINNAYTTVFLKVCLTIFSMI